MFATGRLVDHDPRSRQFRHTYIATTLKPVDWDDDAPITDQGQVGGCTGWSLLDTLNNHLFRGNRIHGTGSDALLPNSKGLEFYSRATRLDGIPNNTYPPTDGGSSGLGAAKAGKAENFLLTYTHGFSMNDFLVALQHQPVMVGTVWTKGMFDPDKTGLIRPTGSEEGGHEYVAFGYNPATGLIKFRNHWTDQWGVKGRFFIRATDFETLLKAQGDVTVPAPIPVTA